MCPKPRFTGEITLNQVDQFVLFCFVLNPLT